MLATLKQIFFIVKLMIDKSFTKEVNEKIEKYNSQTPDKTSTFQVIGLDQATYKIQCWYTELIKNPYFSN